MTVADCRTNREMLQVDSRPQYRVEYKRLQMRKDHSG